MIDIIGYECLEQGCTLTINGTVAVLGGLLVGALVLTRLLKEGLHE